MNEPKYTAEQLQTQAAFAAWQLGEPIQFNLDGRWLDFNSQNSPDICRYQFRPVPAPRYWSEPADIPRVPVLWVRATVGPRKDFEAMLGSVSNRGITYCTDLPALIEWSDRDKFEKMEYSTDRKEWKPCLVQP